MKKTFTLFVFVIVLSCFLSTSMASVPAFPGAEGEGCWATGGRGGEIYEVTNLTNDANTGSGSIVDAVSQPNRTVVFRLSGTIELGDTILKPESHITIAGQTAPGDGICIKGRIKIGNKSEPYIDTNNVVIRYIRVRVDEGGANSSGDAIDIAAGHNIIIDHVSASYSRDETISCQEKTTDITVQWCIMSEALTYEGHSYGSLIRGEYGQEKTYHHNLYAHNQSRNPRPGNYETSDTEGLHFDFRNNVVYNWLKTVPGYGDTSSAVSRYNFIGNVYITGPESTINGYGYREQSNVNYGYFADNSYNDVVDSNAWSIVYFDGLSTSEIADYKARSYIIPMESVTTTSPAQAKVDVLAYVGASYPTRDIIDTRIINDVINQTGSSIETTDDQPEGAWPTLNSTTPPTDTDHDGMPDEWETSHGLNSTNAADRNDYTLSADYTNLEVYLNGLLTITDFTVPAPNPMTWQTAPAAITGTSITMTATTATDDSGVEYFFANITDPNHNSAWQSSTTYTDIGLAPLTTYTYQVKARDMSWNSNETDYSEQACATTPADLDFTAPTPDPMMWDIAPNATGTDTITMTATTATDESGVEYFFANITDPNHDSGWQDGTTFTDTGLLNDTTYTYSVIARDKSTNQNETNWSDEANATTIYYICTAAIDADLNSDCKVDFADYVIMADVWSQIAEPVNLITNGSFDTILEPWTLVNLSSATGTMTASLDETVGEPADSAFISADNTTATNNHRFYQLFPVTTGKQYTFTGRWSGNIVGLVINPTGGSLRNWAEVIISFESSTTPSNWTASSAIMYKKTYGAGTTNTSTGIWNWESITASPTNGPTNGVFTATNSYMVVSFNVGGRASSGSPYAYIDNISVVETTPCPTADLNGDCVLNWLDIEQLAADWLVCNREPTDECWQ